MNKTLPPSDILQELVKTVPTPFYLYDAQGIKDWTSRLQEAFRWNRGFIQFFAVKATPNPHILDLLHKEGCGADCSSPVELEICKRLGISGDEIMFTSNNTSLQEFAFANELGAILNLDTPDHLEKIEQFANKPFSLAFRYNPGREAAGNVIIGNPIESKFGCTREQLMKGYARAKNNGFTRLGLHAMIVSNELSVQTLLANVEMLFSLAIEILEQCNVKLEFINLGGGIGIPYRPEDKPVDIAHFGASVRALFEKMLEPAGLGSTRIMMENGRAATGPYAWLITRVTNVKTTYKKYIGVDACMSNLMRPGMYGAYHHISPISTVENRPLETVDVVGSLCENNDKFAINRDLPSVQVGDLLAVHDCGAHSHAMGFQYNGRLRSAEYLYHSDGRIQRIRRAETEADYFATVDFPEKD